MADTTTSVRTEPAAVRAPGGPVGGSVARATRSIVATHRALCVVLGGYALAAVLLPTRLNIVILDDWIYVRQAREFATHLTLHIHNEAAANAVFDTVWGGTFGLVLGPHLWVFRLSSIVLSLLGGIGAYALCRELAVARNAAAAAAAIVLFNPLAFVLSYSFMTDTHLMNLVILSTWAYVRGIRGSEAAGWLWAGSALAALAYLCRPQGALIPLAVLAFFVITRKLRVDREGMVLVARVALIPATTFVPHRVWLTAVNGVPHDQSGFVEQFFESSATNISILTGKLMFSQTVYFGLVLVPLALGVVWFLVPAARGMSRLGWVLFAMLAVAVLGSVAYAYHKDWRMPYLHDWVGSHGLGPSKPLQGVRPQLLGTGALDALTVVSVVSTLVLGFAAARAITDRSMPRRAEAGLVACVLVVTMLGAIPQGVLYNFNIDPPAPDRYVVSAIPLAIVLGFWAVQRLAVAPALVVAAILVMAAISVLGTRDSLELQRAMWRLDRYANSIGIGNHELDGGAAWTRFKTAGRGPEIPLLPGAVTEWWLVDGRTDGRYAISMQPLPGYDVVHRMKVDQWLTDDPVHVYLIRLRDRG
jgi:4-amino-4-deoxy-L-arabinose transferase-like glycosyltransferase